MSTAIDDKKKFREKLKDTYRIVVIDNADLKEVGNYQLTMGRIYTLLLTSMLIFAILLMSLISFTPLRRLIPGYGDIEENREFIELRKKIGVLEEELDVQVTYTQGLQNMLSGNTELNVEMPFSDDKKEEKAGAPIAALTKENVQESKVTQQLNNQYFVPPVIGTISASYDRATGHLGTDIMAPEDTPVKSIATGVVISSDFHLETGNTITIQHRNDIISIYKHNSALLKKAGDSVSPGEAIAIIGNTGELTDGPHLHFELWYKGTPVNPENFVIFK